MSQYFEVHPMNPQKRLIQQAVDIIGGDRHIADTIHTVRPGVARGHVNIGHARRGGQFPGQGMLAPAVADDQKTMRRNGHGVGAWKARGCKA